MNCCNRLFGQLNEARWTRWALMLGCLAIFGAGCSIKKMGVNKLGDALAGGGTAFTSDDDPELVKAAVPFSLKLMESLLNESPRHRGLLFATASGFTQYAYAFVQQDADELEDKDLDAATALRARAKRLFVRARNYGLRGLAVSHRDFEKALRADPKVAVRAALKSDVPLLYWTAASWAAAISLSKDNPQLVSEQPVIEALIDHALELDESFGHGAIHSFLISYEMSRQGAGGDPVTRAKRHLDRALELSGGKEVVGKMEFTQFFNTFYQHFEMQKEIQYYEYDEEMALEKDVIHNKNKLTYI